MNSLHIYLYVNAYLCCRRNHIPKFTLADFRFLFENNLDDEETDFDLESTAVVTEKSAKKSSNLEAKKSKAVFNAEEVLSERLEINLGESTHAHKNPNILSPNKRNVNVTAVMKYFPQMTKDFVRLYSKSMHTII